MCVPGIAYPGAEETLRTLVSANGCADAALHNLEDQATIKTEGKTDSSSFALPAPYRNMEGNTMSKNEKSHWATI